MKSFPYCNFRFIIDYTEIFIETLKKLSLQSNTWSDYEHHITVKFLLSIHPNGQFNFASNGYGGHVSDKTITVHSGFYDLVEARDLIMTDKGFIILETNSC